MLMPPALSDFEQHGHAARVDFVYGLRLFFKTIEQRIFLTVKIIRAKGGYVNLHYSAGICACVI